MNPLKDRLRNAARTLKQKLAPLLQTIKIRVWIPLLSRIGKRNGASKESSDLTSPDFTLTSTGLIKKGFNWRAAAEWIQKRVQQKNAPFYGTLVVVTVCAFFLADLSALLIESWLPAPPVARVASTGGYSSSRKKTIDDYQIIFDRNLLSSSGKMPGEEPTGEPTDQGGAPVKSSLPLTLVGTLVLQNELKSIATIEDKAASMVYPVRIDDEIPGKAKIIGIEAYKVIFVNTTSGRREFIDLPQETFAINPRIASTTPSLLAPKGGAPGAGIDRTSNTEFNVARTEVDKALQDINQVLTQARAVPNFENGQPAGYKLFQIVPGSIYDKLGLQNGDVLCGLNGQPINDPGKAFELLGELKTSSHLDLCVKRDSKKSDFSYNIR